MPTTIGEAITGAKLPAETVKGLRVGSVVQTGATAAGSAQGDALAVTTGACLVVVTTTAASTGIRLPASRFPGDEITVVNQGVNSLNVYPATGDKINGGSANAAVVLPTNTSRIFTFREAATVGWAG